MRGDFTFIQYSDLIMFIQTFEEPRKYEQREWKDTKCSFKFIVPNGSFILSSIMATVSYALVAVHHLGILGNALNRYTMCHEQ